MGVGLDSPWHWLILAVVVFALFGYKKLPDATRSVGRSLRIFKSEMKGMHDEEPKTTNQPAPEQRVVPPPVIEARPVDLRPAPPSGATSQPSRPSTPSRPSAPSRPSPPSSTGS